MLHSLNKNKTQSPKKMFFIRVRIRARSDHEKILEADMSHSSTRRATKKDHANKYNTIGT